MMAQRLQKEAFFYWWYELSSPTSWALGNEFSNRK
uniref:Uncharacterized protein n=1 Tax=Anguilla anguilla TaxID=7936 RepID=A0A0E9RK88_ANGAN